MMDGYGNGPGLAIAIMSKKKPSEESYEDLGKELGDQFLGAIAEKDSEAVFEAFKGMMDLCNVGMEDDY